jgi:hypothetical protein
MPRVSASKTAIWRDGRRSSLSIFRMAEIEQPTRSASASWVKSRALRRWRNHLPKEISEFIENPAGIVTLFVVINVLPTCTK